MSETKLEPKVIFPYAVIAIMAIAYFYNKNDIKVDKSKSVESITSSVFKDQRALLRAIFDDAAKKVESKEIKTDRQLLELIKPQAESARMQSKKTFDAMIEERIPESFDGKELEVASLLRKVARSW